MTGSSSERNYTIDFLRIVFTVIIVLNHGIKNLPGQMLPFEHSRVAVEFFFIVSGFLMAASAARYSENRDVSVWKQTGGFIRHKIIRIAPDVFIAWFVAFFVCVIIPGRKGVIHKLLSGGFEFFFLSNAGFAKQIRVNDATWYLSAMIIAMAVLFPLAVRKRDMFLHWFAPLAAVFLYGFFAMKFGKIAGNMEWGGFSTMGLLRALCGICLGAACYTIAGKLRLFRLSLFGKILVSAAAFLSIAYVIWSIYRNKPSVYDFVLIAMMAFSLTLIFSNTGLNLLNRAPVFIRSVIGFLGGFSLDLYLSHGYWSKRLGKMLPGLTGRRMLLTYLIIAVANALLLMLVSKLLRKKWPDIKKTVADLFIAKQN